MKKYNIPALEKAILILEFIATSEKEHSATTIHKELNLPKSTVFTTLHVLETHEFVRKNKQGIYEIGMKLYQLGMAYHSKMDLVQVARPHLETLMQNTGFTVHLGILEDGEILFIDKVEPNSFIKFSTFLGMRQAFHITALGKAMAAFLDEQELDEMILKKGLGKSTPKTLTDPIQLKKSLDSVRKQGYAVEDEEGEIGVRCVGAPIFSKDGKQVIAAISVTAIVSDLDGESLANVGKVVSETGLIISKELGMADERDER